MHVLTLRQWYSLYNDSMPTILFVDDEAIARQNYSTILEHGGYTVVLAKDFDEAVASHRAGESFDLVLTDMRMNHGSGLDLLRIARTIEPQPDVMILTGHAEIPNVIEAMKLGAVDYVTKETDYKEILISIEKVIEKRVLRKEVQRLRTKLRAQYSFDRIIGESAATKALIRTLARVAPTDSRVLITGESGTGKELVAETIHMESTRKDAPFIAINCGAIAANLQESELFGFVRGAFTGADRDKTGLLEAAHGGTIFLDEIGDMSLETQVKLLRVLESGEVLPVGSTTARKINVRVLAATNRDLMEGIRQKTFREDLYYRLHVVTIAISPLRDRPADILPIAASIIEALNPKMQKRVHSISTEAQEALLEYNWPGNVRELRNVIERALIFADGEELSIEDLPEELFRGSAPDTASVDTTGPAIVPLDEVERRHILDTLARLHGNKFLTAKHLRIAATTLYRKLKQYGID
jgi:DNA-binding NtrC family response regulator